MAVMGPLMLQAGKDAQSYRRAPPPDATPSGSSPGRLAAPVSPVFSGRDQASAPSMAAPDRGRQMGQKVRHDYGNSIIALSARQHRPAHAPRAAPYPLSAAGAFRAPRPPADSSARQRDRARIKW